MRYVYVQQNDGTLVPKEEWQPTLAPEIVPDIGPYQSMATGEMIGSRREHRDHLKRYNLQEIGNEKLEAKPVKIVDPTRKKVIGELVNHFGEDRIRSDARQLGEFLKWNSRGRNM